MVNNWTLSWDRILPALKHSDKTFEKKKTVNFYQKSQTSEKKPHICEKTHKK